MLIHKTEYIIFLNFFIIKQIEIVHIYRVQCYAKSLLPNDLDHKKKLPYGKIFLIEFLEFAMGQHITFRYKMTK